MKEIPHDRNENGYLMDDVYAEDIFRYDWAKRMNYDLESRTSFATRLYMRFTETRLYAFLRAHLRRK